VGEDVIKLRWVLLALYGIIVLGLLGTALTQTLGSPVWLGFFNVLGNEPVWTIVVLLATVVSQAVFVFCSCATNTEENRGRRPNKKIEEHHLKTSFKMNSHPGREVFQSGQFSSVLTSSDRKALVW
jgi:hypothetical protein